MAGYFWNDQIAQPECDSCADKLPMCVDCSSGSTCTQCQDNAVLLPDRNCQLCSKKIEGCKVCENFDKCSKCEDNYNLENSKCVASSGSAAIIIVCVVAGLVAIGSVGILSHLCRLHRFQEGENQQEEGRTRSTQKHHPHFRAIQRGFCQFGRVNTALIYYPQYHTTLFTIPPPQYNTTPNITLPSIQHY